LWWLSRCIFSRVGGIGGLVDWLGVAAIRGTRLRQTLPWLALRLC